MCLQYVHDSHKFRNESPKNLIIALFFIIGTKRKLHKEGDFTSDLLTMLSKLDEQADARMEEREKKQALLEAELERRREQERKHEERMQTMFLGVMHNMMAWFGNTAPPQIPSPGTPFPQMNPYSNYPQPNVFPHPPYQMSSSGTFPPTSPFPSAYVNNEDSDD